MRNKGFLLLAFISLLLVACSPNDKGEAKLPGDTEQTPSSDLGRPPDIRVGSKTDVTATVRDKYCWENTEKDCSLQPHNPEELVSGNSAMVVHPGDEISIGMVVSDSTTPRELWSIDELEIIQHFKGEESKVDAINTNDHSFQAPQEAGRYYFSAILRWNGDIKGEAIYAFSFFVKE